MEIFLDVLILENIIMNYFILIVTSKLSRTKTTNLRVFLGALVGAVYVALMVLMPNLKIYYTAFAKILLSIVIILISFRPKNIGSLFKNLAVFYISTFIFAGAAFAFIYFEHGEAFIRNGVIYVFWQSKWTILVLSVILVGIIVRIFWEIIQFKFIKEKLLIPLKISFENKTSNLPALIDTGNSLRDPITNMPVIVVEFSAIKEILPSDIQSIFEESRENDLDSISCIISDSRWFSRFRLIPYMSLGKENGMLIGFKPDYIEIGEDEEKKGMNDVIVGIYNRALTKNERYRALLSPELI